MSESSPQKQNIQAVLKPDNNYDKSHNMQSTKKISLELLQLINIQYMINNNSIHKYFGITSGRSARWGAFIHKDSRSSFVCVC